MTNLLSEFVSKQNADLISSRSDNKVFETNFRSGDTVRVKYKIVDGSTSRSQLFVGIVIGRSKNSKNYSATFTVRKISNGVGVERMFQLYSPLLLGVEVLKRGVVRRAKLYYLRNLTGKASRIKEKMDFFSDPDETIKN